MPTTYINGRYIPSSHAQIAANDRGFLFSDGVYEVIAYRNNRWIDWEWHIERLHHSLNALDLPSPLSDPSLALIAQRMMKQHHLKDGYIYLQITRGAAPRKHAFPSPAVKPTIMITAHRWPSYPTTAYSEGVSLVTSKDIRWGRRDIKSISLLPNVLAAEKARSSQAMETVLIDNDIITECSASNIFIIDTSGTLFTHPANEHILGGITRRSVLSLAKKLDIPYKERAFTLNELSHAKEVFITSTTKGVMPVKAIENMIFTPGAITEKLRKNYDLS